MISKPDPQMCGGVMRPREAPEERFVRDMFLVPNPSRHWLARRIVQTTRVRTPAVSPDTRESRAPIGAGFSSAALFGVAAIATSAGVTELVEIASYDDYLWTAVALVVVVGVASLAAALRRERTNQAWRSAVEESVFWALAGIWVPTLAAVASSQGSGWLALAVPTVWAARKLAAAAARRLAGRYEPRGWSSPSVVSSVRSGDRG